MASREPKKPRVSMESGSSHCSPLRPEEVPKKTGLSYPDMRSSIPRLDPDPSSVAGVTMTPFLIAKCVKIKTAADGGTVISVEHSSAALCQWKMHATCYPSDQVFPDHVVKITMQNLGTGVVTAVSFPQHRKLLPPETIERLRQLTVDELGSDSSPDTRWNQTKLHNETAKSMASCLLSTAGPVSERLAEAGGGHHHRVVAFRRAPGRQVQCPFHCDNDSGLCLFV